MALGIYLLSSGPGAPPSSTPKLEALRVITELPAGVPQRVTGLAFDGQKLWATVYQGNGQYVHFDPSTGLWEISQEKIRHKAIAETAGDFASPGAICVVNGTLWVAGSYGNAFGSIDIQTWKIERVFKVKQREDEGATQSYASMACDGSHLWIAWHWFRYDIPVSQTQLLLKIDPQTGKTIAEYPAPAGNANDMAHGLTWDGSKLWHVKDKTLSAIDPATGIVTAQYTIPELKRPSGLAWDGSALWISEFHGRIWHLPF